jgi:teichuronic acid biosynthesis glycosyltransferase TuaG
MANESIKSKLVSIIVPVYNGERYVLEAIESVRHQTWQEWEMLLVLDGCIDKSQQLIEEYCAKHQEKRIHVLVKEKNEGAARARNLGLKQAKGRYIAYLDGDDIWKDEKLEKELAFMEEQGAAFAFTGYEFADEGGIGIGKIVHVPRTLKYQEALKNTTIFTSTVMFDTQRLPKSLLVMPEIKSEDTALWWKVLKSGERAYGLNENLALYRRPGKSLSSNKFEAIRRIWNLYRSSENLSIMQSLFYFCFWALRAVKRRI